MWPVHQVFNTLVETDDSLHLIPSLAKDWVVMDKGLTYRFFLRNDVKFHDDKCFPNGKGRRMLAADVVFSLSRIIDPKTASPGAWIFNHQVDSIRPFTAVNDTTIDIHLSAPNSTILGVLSMPYCSVIPKEAVTLYGDQFGHHPIGTGPFAFSVWYENEALLLKKNPHYFEQDKFGKSLPYLDGIKISFIESKASEFMEFRQGHLDFVNDIDPAFKDQVLTHSGKLKKNWEDLLTLQMSPYLNVEYLGIKSLADDNNPLKEIKIRKAIEHAIDKKKLLFYLRNSVGTVAENGFVHPALLYEKTKGYVYDTSMAKLLLRQSGYPERFSKPEIRLVTVPTFTLIGNYIVSELNKVGIQAKLETMQKSALLEQMSGGQVSFFRGSWIADYPDASNYLSVFYGKNPAPPNYTRYQNTNYDTLFERVKIEQDEMKRQVIFHQLDSMVMADAQVVPLWYDRVLHLLQKNVRNLRDNPTNMLELRSVYKSD